MSFSHLSWWTVTGPKLMVHSVSKVTKKEKNTHKTALTSCHNYEIERKKENNKRKLRSELWHKHCFLLCDGRCPVSTLPLPWRHGISQLRVQVHAHAATHKKERSQRAERKRNEKADETQRDGLTFWGLSFRCSAAMSLYWARHICQSQTEFRSGER